MSHSEYYIFGVDGALIADVEGRNSHGSGPAIWAPLCMKYFRSDVWVLSLERFWKEKIDETLTDDERLVLYLTYEGLLLPRSEFQKFVEVVGRFPFDPKAVNHWPEVAKFVEKYADDENVLGFGVYGTSLSDNPWTHHSAETGMEEHVDPRKASRVVYGEKRPLPPLAEPKPGGLED